MEFIRNKKINHKGKIMYYYYDLSELIKLKNPKKFFIQINKNTTIITFARNKQNALKKALNYAKKNNLIKF